MQEIIIKKLSFRNFLSFGNKLQVIDFAEKTSTFIYGENLDTNSANGCGKTALFQALVYGLYNKSISNISHPRLVNSTNSSKNTIMEIIVEFSKGNNEYKVTRFRGAKTSVTIEANGEDITPASMADSDTLVETILGISYDLFSKVVVFSGSATPFLDLPVAQQRQHIEELFNITLLSEKAEILKKKIQQTDFDISTEEVLNNEKQNNIIAHEKRIKTASDRVIMWENNLEKEISSLEKQIESIENVNIEEQQALLEEKQSVSLEVNGLNSKLTLLERDLQSKEKIYNKNTSEIQHLSDNTCPYCKQKYANVDQKISELKELQIVLEKEIPEDADQIEKINDENKQLSDRLQNINLKLVVSDVSKLLETKKNIDAIKFKLSELKKSQNPHFQSLEDLEKEQITEIDFERLDQLKNLKAHQTFLLKLLTDKNSFIRRRIINKTIPFLNSRLNYYTNELGLPHVVKFDDNMSCSVSEYNRELDFGNLSAGEKKRVNLSMSLAFRDVLHNLHSKINILLVDEIDASLCSSGVERVIKLLKKKTKEDFLSSWVIMHRPEAAGRFDRDLLIQKSGGFSEFFFSE